MFVRLSARSRTHRPCEDIRIRKVLPFLLDLRRRKCRRISRTASPARKLHTHTRQKRDGERKRQSWVAKSVVVLVYSARLQIVSLRSRKAWWMKKDMKPRGMQKGWKKWMPTVDAECMSWMNVSRTNGRKRFLFIRLWLDDVVLVFSARFTVVCSEQVWMMNEKRHDRGMMQNGWKNGWTPTGDAECWHLKKNNEWIHREPMDESIFYSSVNVPWTSLLCSFAAGSMMNEKKTYERGMMQ